MDKLLKPMVINGVLLSLVSAILVAVGFVSRFAEGRVLGAETWLSGGVLSYAIAGGNFAVQTSQALYRLPLNFEYIPTRSVIWFGLGTVLLVAGSVAVLRWAPAQIKNVKRLIAITLIAAAFSYTANIFGDVLSLNSTIQPFSVDSYEGAGILSRAMVIKEPNTNSSNRASRSMHEYVDRKFSACANGGNKIHCLFDWRRFDGLNDRKETYITLTQLVVTLIFVVMVSRWLWVTKFTSVCLYLFIPLQLFFLAYTHGAIASDYRYPIITMTDRAKLETARDISGVFMVSRHKNSILLLDRRNGVRYLSLQITDTDIVEINGFASPFENCSVTTSGFELCERRFW